MPRLKRTPPPTQRTLLALPANDNEIANADAGAMSVDSNTAPLTAVRVTRKTGTPTENLLDIPTNNKKNPARNFNMLSDGKRKRICGDTFFGENSTLEIICNDLAVKVNQLTASMTRTEMSISVINSSIRKLMDEKQNLSKELVEIKNMHSTLMEKIDTLVLSAEREKLDTAKNVQAKSFADVIKETESGNVVNNPNLPSSSRKPENVIVIKPIDTNQESKITMAAIKSKISPTKKNIIKVRNAAKGSVLIECSSKEDIQNLKTDAEQKLGEAYSISIPEKKLPKLRVFGISDEMSAEDIKKRLIQQNENIFNDNSVINIFNVSPAKNSDRFVFKLECDPEAFSLALLCGKLKIGWDICFVHEIVEVLRCFKCNKYGHLSKKCTENEHTCPKCSGNHDHSECQSTEAKCSNCVRSNIDLNMNLDTNHFAWSTECEVYKRQLVRQQKRVNYGGD